MASVPIEGSLVSVSSPGLPVGIAPHPAWVVEGVGQVVTVVTHVVVLVFVTVTQTVEVAVVVTVLVQKTVMVLRMVGRIGHLPLGQISSAWAPPSIACSANAYLARRRGTHQKDCSFIL